MWAPFEPSSTCGSPRVEKKCPVGTAPKTVVCYGLWNLQMNDKNSFTNTPRSTQTTVIQTRSLPGGVSWLDQTNNLGILETSYWFQPKGKRPMKDKLRLSSAELVPRLRLCCILFIILPIGICSEKRNTFVIQSQYINSKKDFTWWDGDSIHELPFHGSCSHWALFVWPPARKRTGEGH